MWPASRLFFCSYDSLNVQMRGKRELLARMCSRTGLTRALETLPQRRALTILNYHRIGNADETPFDSGVFSATADQFDAQITYLKRRFRMATLEDVFAMVDGNTPRGTSVLITFDDGYLDNYTLAFPMLRAHGVQAVFFLPTAFIGTGKLPWWDVIAYVIKRSLKRRIRLEYPEPASFDLAVHGGKGVSMEILRLSTQPAVKDPERFLLELETECEVARPEAEAERCFLNWDEAREMQQHGMAFGSHTHSHEILTKLSAERQREEVRYSREILERELNQRVETLAYPVGLQHCFSSDTVRALEETGYRAAFSYYGGSNQVGRIRPFDIRRYGVADASFARFRLQTSLRAVTGTGSF
jgi:peptidoglycan/xylan/chitin deacetylase (PgdA/CDA1 family)